MSDELNFLADTPNTVPLARLDWKRLFGYLKPHWGRLSLAMVAVLLSTGFGLLFPTVIVQLLETVTTAGDLGALTRFTLILVGVFLLQSALDMFRGYLLAFIGERIVLELRTSLFRHLQSLSMDFFGERRVGEIVSRLSSDVTAVRSVLTSSLTSLISQLLTLIGAVVIVITMNAQLTLFILAISPVLILVAIFFGRKVQRISTQVQDQLADATVVAEESLQGVRIVKSFARENYEVNRYQQAMQKTFGTSMNLAKLNTLFGGVMSFLGFGAIAAILWFGGREVIEGRLTLPMITGFLIYGITIATSLGGLAALYAQVRGAAGGIQRVFDILDTQPTIQDAPQAQTLPQAKGKLTFENVSFHYPKGEAVLEHFDLEIQPGEIIALVGPSGAGKSTVFNLIPRFYDPSEGRVLIDGIDLRECQQQSLRHLIGVVPQETLLFGGTIRENILYGRLDASEDEVIEAAKAAYAHDFILELPEGYNTLVGERGTRLSGGQRQRIAIARAILKNPRILLLDEATSALDNQSEEWVQAALDHLMQGRTTVIVAHRLSTIKVAHRIVVLQQGKIIEMGSHEELMGRNGLYARLYSMQFRDPEEEVAALQAMLKTQKASKPLPPSETPPAKPGIYRVFGR